MIAVAAVTALVLAGWLLRRRALAGLRPVQARDALWLQDSPTNRTIVNAVLVADRLELAALQETVRDRVIEADGRRRFPRFTWRLVARGGAWGWAPEAGFRLEGHVRQAEVPEIGSEEELRRFIESQVVRPLAADRPPWEMLLVPRYLEDRSAILFRSHHAMCDGIALARILFSLTDPLSGGAADRTRTHAERRRSHALVYAAAVVLAPVLLLWRLIERGDRSAVRGPAPRGDKRVAWSPAIPLERLKALRGARGTTVNDVLLAGVAGAFARYLAARGETVASVRAILPMNVREAADACEMENQFASVSLRLPVAARDGRERLARIRRITGALKRSVEPLAVYGASRAMVWLLPSWLSRWLIDLVANKGTLVLTNMPGPTGGVALAGARLRDMMFWVPQRSMLGVGVSLFSYEDRVRLGVLSDVAVMDDPARLVRAFLDELDDLEASTGEGGAGPAPPCAPRASEGAADSAPS